MYFTDDFFIGEKIMNYIKCPHCGAEYLPVEIFIPEEFFGRPKEIIRRSDNHAVETFFGKEPDLKERYVCDYCKTPFEVTATMSFETKEVPRISKETKISARKYSLFMDEL